jgi:hypothetical protein
LAATDGKNQLRYTAGDDAKTLVANRQQYDDATFMAVLNHNLDFKLFDI